MDRTRGPPWSSTAASRKAASFPRRNTPVPRWGRNGRTAFHRIPAEGNVPNAASLALAARRCSSPPSEQVPDGSSDRDRPPRGARKPASMEGAEHIRFPKAACLKGNTAFGRSVDRPPFSSEMAGLRPHQERPTPKLSRPMRTWSRVPGKPASKGGLPERLRRLRRRNSPPVRSFVGPRPDVVGRFSPRGRRRDREGDWRRHLLGARADRRPVFDGKRCSAVRLLGLNIG